MVLISEVGDYKGKVVFGNPHYCPFILLLGPCFAIFFPFAFFSPHLLHSATFLQTGIFSGKEMVYKKIFKVSASGKAGKSYTVSPTMFPVVIKTFSV